MAGADGGAWTSGGSSAPGGPQLWRRRSLLAGLIALPLAAATGGVYRLSSGDGRRDPGPAGDAPPEPRASPSSPSTEVADDAPDHPSTSESPGPAEPARWSVVEENARPGTTDWQIPQDPAAWDKVRGFLTRTSATRGERVALLVSTGAASFTARAYRMGHYGGTGGRLVWTSGPVAGRRQAEARIDRAARTRDAPWDPSVWITLDDSWVPGAYLFVLQSSDGGSSQVPFVVRDDTRRAAVHIQHDVTTWQAYNRWGGACLYDGKGGRATKVCFDRPYDQSGSGHFLGGAREIGALVESLGLDVTYSTSLDTHARPELIRQHRVWISPAHDEYWSLEMRNGVEAARDAGVNLVFLGANCMFRRIRLEDTFLGPNRMVVNYRSAALDPVAATDPERATTSWREPPAARPESSIIGTYYESNPVKADMVIVDAGAWMFEGTGVRNGDRWPDLVGNEYDRVTPEAPTPPTIQVLAHSPVKVRGQDRFADMTYYTAPSGAGVFASGSIWFERHVAPGGRGTDAQISAMVANILRVFAEGPAGRRHPARPNLDRLGIHAGYLPPFGDRGRAAD